MKHQRN